MPVSMYLGLLQAGQEKKQELMCTITSTVKHQWVEMELHTITLISAESPQKKLRKRNYMLQYYLDCQEQKKSRTRTTYFYLDCRNRKRTETVQIYYPRTEREQKQELRTFTSIL